MPGTTARVQRKVLVRLASTTARQSSSETSSSGRPTWPTTPPALLTRTSTAPIRSRSAADRGGVAHVDGVLVDAVHRRARRRCSAAAIAAPMPWAVPVTSATLPSSSGTPAQPFSMSVAHLVDAGLPRRRCMSSSERW